MIKNLILVAFRNLVKDKGYSLLNILGLTIGITFSLFLVFYILDELSYDRYYTQADRIFRINADIQEPENSMKWATTQFPLVPVLQKDFPEVEEAVRFVNADRKMFKKGELKFYEEKIYYTDSNVFKVFDYKMIEGNPVTALIEPNSIVLTASLAEKYFGKTTGVTGNTLEDNDGKVFKVTAILEDIPKNSHILFNVLISRSTLPQEFADSWGSFGFYTYVLLKPQVSAKQFEDKLLPMYDKYMAPIFAQFNIKIQYGVQPVTAIHLHSEMSNEPEELGSMSYIYILSAVAFFMLLIACINYMNLTTARSARRSKEIGIRKVSGSGRAQLISQFLIESTLTACIALVCGIGLTILLLPVFNQLAGKYFTIQNLISPSAAYILLSIILFVGLVGGSYPAFYLSKFNPVSVLKGSLSRSSGNLGLRKTLVVIQFSISMIMLICTYVVYGQLKYIKEKDLGFERAQVASVQINSTNNMRSRISSFINTMRNDPNVLSVSASQSTPGGQNINFNLFSVESQNGFVDKGVDCYGVDENFIHTLGIKVVTGRNFTSVTDTLRSILVNESMVRTFGWDNPIGKRVKFPGDTSGFYLEVVGVLKDFHQKSLYNPINPLILFCRPNSNVVAFKLHPENIESTLIKLESLWRTSFPGLPFEYTFLDADFDSQYVADQKRGRIFTSFALLTILITCLGLLGLIAFTTEQRQKELSIRKIMGAGIYQLVSLVTVNFVVLVGISCLIAFPIAYYFMHKWLAIFPYNSGLRPMSFIWSALVVLMITLVTVLFHTIKASLANPSKSLRTE